MKAILASIALLPPLRPVAADAGLPPAQQELFDTERAFVRLAAEKGFRDSFYAISPTTASHSIRIRSACGQRSQASRRRRRPWAPTGRRSTATSRGPATSAGTRARSCSRARTAKPDRHGMFFSIWKRQADGSSRSFSTSAATRPPPSCRSTSRRIRPGAPVSAAPAGVDRRRAEGQPARAPSGPSCRRRRRKASAAPMAAGSRTRRACIGPAPMPVVGRVALGEWANAQVAKVSRRAARSPTSRGRATSATPTATTNGRARRPRPATTRASGRRTRTATGASSWTP